MDQKFWMSKDSQGDNQCWFSELQLTTPVSICDEQLLWLNQNVQNQCLILPFVDSAHETLMSASAVFYAQSAVTASNRSSNWCSCRRSFGFLQHLLHNPHSTVWVINQRWLINALTVVVKWHTVFLVAPFTSPSPGSWLTVWITLLICLLSHLLVIFWRFCHTVLYASISVELHIFKRTILSADRLWIVAKLDLYSKIC